MRNYSANLVKQSKKLGKRMEKRKSEIVGPEHSRKGNTFPRAKGAVLRGSLVFASLNS